MAVLAADIETTRKAGGIKSYLMGTDVIYKGGLVLINAAGAAVAAPVAASAVGLKLAGVAYEKVDDSAGAGTKWCKVFTRGLFKFTASSISQAMVGEMMYLVDDQTIDDVPGTYGIPVGILVEYVSTTSGWIDIEPALALQRNPKSLDLDFITKTDSYTVLVTDSGAKFAIATDAKVFTLPSTARGLRYQFWNTGATTTTIITISPAAADGINGGGLAASAVNKDLINTKATALYGDMVEIIGTGTAGTSAWIITKLIGTWAKEA